MSAPLRVLFVLPHPVEGPSSRFRVYQFLPFLVEHGVEADVRPLFSSLEAPAIYAEGGAARKVALTARAAARRAGDVARAKRFDVAYVLREAFPFGPPVFERALKAAAGKLVFDFDDAIYVPSTAYDNPLDRLRDWGKTAKVIAMSDHVVAGGRHLADYARRHAAPERVTALPTVVDASAYAPSPCPRPARPFTVGWIGTPRGTSYLHPLRGAMRRLRERLGEVRFVFVGAEPFEVGDLPVEFRAWRLDREVADIQGFDAGIMPLADDEEARGKCGFKLIQYMSCGVPVVCSPVGANRDVVADGRTGLYADGEDGWFEALARIAGDDALRARLSAAGRSTVETEFCSAVVAPRLLEILRAAAGR